MDHNRMTAVFHSLSDLTRLRIVTTLMQGPTAVGDIAKTLNISLWNISSHLNLLRREGVVEFTKERQHRFYTLSKSIYNYENKSFNFGGCQMAIK